MLAGRGRGEALPTWEIWDAAGEVRRQRPPAPADCTVHGDLSWLACLRLHPLLSAWWGVQELRRSPRDPPERA
jgi:hypothetical protein